MRSRSLSFLLTLVLALVHSFLWVTPLKAQLAPVAYDEGALGLAFALRKLPTTGSFLMITAHPDDEDSALLAAMARTESSFQPGAVSPAGAQGLMQLMPGTARGLGVADPFDPAQAVDGAARLMRDLIDRFGRVDHALAGYNAGPGAVLRYDGVPPYAETQGYVAKILALVEGA